ncbi:unnamed protein product, partial [Brassica rapa subsp. trilocularis]
SFVQNSLPALKADSLLEARWFVQLHHPLNKSHTIPTPTVENLTKTSENPKKSGKS